MKVVWTEHALRCLIEIEDYIAGDDPAAAVIFVERLIRRTLENQPLAGRLVPEVPGRDLRERIEGNYRIVYRVNEATAEILTVFEAHKRFNYETGRNT
jgi:plasmid stabilization system protein ParE